MRIISMTSGVCRGRARVFQLLGFCASAWIAQAQAESAASAPNMSDEAMPDADDAEIYPARRFRRYRHRP